MKRKRENEGNMMEQAIEKASQLITLLQKENGELKKKNDLLEKQMGKMNEENQQLKKFNKELEEQLNVCESKYEEMRVRFDSSDDSFAKCEENLKRKIGANKELHEKISNLNLKLKQLTKASNQQKIKMLSLQNQNEYLLKKLKDCGDKENVGLHKINLKYADYESELKEVIRIKQAFARRCQELKADNLVLTEKAAEYKQKLIDAQSSVLPKPRLILPSPKEPPKIIKLNTNTSYQDLVDKLLIQKLGVQPVNTFEGKIDQIGSFLSYRLSHIEKIWQGIKQKLQIKEWNKVQNLKDLTSSSLRIHSYLSELLNRSL